ncbi:energy transducer TonB family protein [Bradyrhizobium liaoningense]|uniref:energy transducer TonB family protein n=1 Tax=Bradyrhizobium liaoningense TaxID=43992 RepID=UPI001BAB64BD|nr:energy transducer TonB [Bradyrhizobium liaoningense]MBR0710841.1 energy transducer TonB [Bradyrhizobium liaoningense]
MAANAFALHEPLRERETARWGASGAVIVALHVAAALLAMSFLKSQPEQGVSLPAIMVDMSPVTSAPQSTPLDLAPGPVMEQADASPPDWAAPQAVEETLAPTPPQDKPEVVAPPEQKLKPAEAESAKVVTEARPEPVKPKVVRPEAKKPSHATPAPRTTASGRAERQAPAASAVSAGASAAAIASYNQMVAAHLQRFKQYPPASKAAGENGVARLSFTLSRSGQVLGSRLAGSSGYSALDAETMAMVRRAQPFPAFPAEITHATMSFTVPISFSIR